MRAARKLAKDVKRGDEILTPYHPRTWLPVEQVMRFRRIVNDRDWDITIDTRRNRTFWRNEDLVPCRKRSGAEAIRDGDCD